MNSQSLTLVVVLVVKLLQHPRLFVKLLLNLFRCRSGVKLGPLGSAFVFVFVEPLNPGYTLLSIVLHIGLLATRSKFNSWYNIRCWIIEEESDNIFSVLKNQWTLIAPARARLARTFLHFFVRARSSCHVYRFIDLVNHLPLPPLPAV